ncbi:MAG TPA: dihydroorotate dehydrogenase electron transfer subunit [Clostridiales bacterium]|jgi:dihydroorotate dehydrogenase electron transfer subunit|nr:dihydroorotate dehydrogenase electron transfer subunit [Clostridiales bacterium]
MKTEITKILGNNLICDNIFEIVVAIDIRPLPGQFYMIKGLNGDYLLPRPISVHDYEDGVLKLLYRVSGHGTNQISRLKKGDNIQIFGPLGNGFDVKLLKGKIAVIGGGIGIAPLLYLAKNIESQNLNIYLGYKDDTFCVESFEVNCDKLTIVTENGCAGKKGYVTDFVNVGEFDTVITCGPDMMMEKIIRECVEKNIPVYASLEKRMACGIGACLGCVVSTIDGNKRVCKDGPVFSGRDLMIRSENG